MLPPLVISRLDVEQAHKAMTDSCDRGPRAATAEQRSRRALGVAGAGTGAGLGLGTALGLLLLDDLATGIAIGLASGAGGSSVLAALIYGGDIGRE